MGINKNFVVKNGLEVDNDLILANAVTNRVGIGTSVPTHLLHVNGGIAATHISVSGVSTLNILDLQGTLSIGNTYGEPLQYLRATGGGGVEWAPLPELRNSVSYVATEGQTEFTFAPTAAYVDVYINGVKQPEVNYIWTNGLKIELIDAASGGDIIEIIGYNTNTVGSGGSGFGAVIGGITVFESGTLKGSAGLVTSINFVGPTVGVNITGLGVTVYSAGGGGGESLWQSTATGIHTLSNVGIGTTNSPYDLTVSGDAYVSGAATVLGSVTLGITSVGTYSTQRSLYVNGGITASGVVTASYYEGDGSRLTNISAAAVDTGWDRQASSGLTTSVNIGIGTTNARYQLEVGAVGDSGLQALINGDLFVAGDVYAGVVTATKFETDTQNISIENSTINSPGLISIGGTAVRVLGNFYVNGTQFITTSVSLQLDNKVIGLGTTTGSPNDISADGGGIILYGDTNKEFLWNYTDNSWNSNVNLGIATIRTLKIGGQDRLSYNSLTVPNANISGVSTIGTVSAGLVTATSIYATEYTGNGNGLSGIVTSIVAGSNISITNSVGRVVISATGGGGGGGGDASVSIGDTAPAAPSSGKLWWDSNTGRGFIYYVDDDSAQWVDFSPNGGVSANTISVRNNGTPLPQAISTLNFNGNVSISTSLSGIATIGINTVVIGTYTEVAGIATYATTAGIATYSTTAGIATYSINAGIATYATISGIATYSEITGISTYATTAGIATYTTTAGIATLATYATSAGIATSIIGGISSVTQLTVTGISTFSGITTFSNNVNFVGVSTNIFYQPSSNSFKYGDNARAYFGSALDLEIYSSGTESVIQERSGGSKKFYISSDDLELRSYNTFEHYLTATAGNGVSLFYDNSKKFETLGTGATVTGTTFTDELSVSGISTFNSTTNLNTTNITGDLTFTGNNDIYLKDGGVINFGDGNDLQIFHNGSVSVIRDGGTGGLLIDSDNEVKIAKNGTGNDNLAVFTPDGSVELYYDNSKKFETLGIGATVTGTTFTNDLSVSGVSTFNNYLKLYNGISFYDDLQDAVGATNNISVVSGVTKRMLFRGNTINKFSFSNYYGGSDHYVFEISRDGDLTASGNLSISGISTFAGITTVTGPTLFTNQLSVSGFSTFTGGFVVPVNNGGTITGSPNSNSLAFTNNVAATFGNGATLSISNDGTTTNIWNGGPLVIRNNSLSGVTSITGNTVGTIADFTQDGEVRIPGKLQVGTGGTVITTTSGGLVGIGTTNPTDKLTVRGGDISVGVSTAHGLVLTSPNGTRFRLVVDDSGTLSTVQI